MSVVVVVVVVVVLLQLPFSFSSFSSFPLFRHDFPSSKPMETDHRIVLKFFQRKFLRGRDTTVVLVLVLVALVVAAVVVVGGGFFMLPNDVGHVYLNISNIDKNVSLDHTRHCIHTCNKKIKIYPRITSTVKVIRAFHNVAGTARYTTSTTNMYNKSFHVPFLQ